VVVTNDVSGFTWGLGLTRGRKTLYCERAGHASVFGAGAFGNHMTRRSGPPADPGQRRSGYRQLATSRRRFEADRARVFTLSGPTISG
jgi:hypothetical protein